MDFIPTKCSVHNVWSLQKIVLNRQFIWPWIKQGWKTLTSPLGGIPDSQDSNSAFSPYFGAPHTPSPRKADCQFLLASWKYGMHSCKPRRSEGIWPILIRSLTITKVWKTGLHPSDPVGFFSLSKSHTHLQLFSPSSLGEGRWGGGLNYLIGEFGKSPLCLALPSAFLLGASCPYKHQIPPTLHVAGLTWPRGIPTRRDWVGKSASQRVR